MKLTKISYQILLTFIIVIVISISTAGWFLLQICENIVINKISVGDQRLAQGVGREVKLERENIKSVLKFLVSSPYWQEMNLSMIKGELNFIEKNFPEITEIYVADLEGNQIAKKGAGKPENVADIWSFQLAKEGQEIFSDIFLDPQTLKPIQIIVLPILENKTVKGVLSAELDFQRIISSIMDVEIGRDGSIFVVAGNGRVIAHTYINQLSDIDFSSVPIVEAVLDGQKGVMKGYADNLGHQVVGTYFPIWELGWGIVVQRSLSEISREVEQVRNVIFITIIISIILAIIAGWLMSGTISKPIRLLAEASERVAGGDLSTSVDIKSSNEIGVLANSFNRMVKELKQNQQELQTSHDELELRVKERTTQLEASMYELEAFAYSVSHDLQAPLRAISGFSEILLKDYLDTLDDQGQHYLQRVRAGTVNMSQMIEDLLTLSRLGRRPINKKRVDLEELVKEAYELLSDTKMKNRKVDFTIKPCPPVSADPHLLKIALTNLLSNALKFTGKCKKAEIEFGNRTEGNNIIFYIKDNGIGFDMKYADKLFSPFQRLHREEEYEGSGIGLAIVQRIIHRHGGKIWAESFSGLGTTFYFTL
ncbi:MAG: ATP-binding protein [Atribacterota bacterium]